METVAYPHILKREGDFARLESSPRTRVSMIVTDTLNGMSPEQVVENYGYKLAEVHAALGYYHDHREEIDAELAEERELAKRPPVFPQFTRAELLARLGRTE